MYTAQMIHISEERKVYKKWDHWYLVRLIWFSMRKQKDKSLFLYGSDSSWA